MKSVFKALGASVGLTTVLAGTAARADEDGVADRHGGAQRAGGPTAIGTFKHLPPFLTAKYNFIPDGTFRPYVGLGLNLTIISDVQLNVPTVGPLSLDHTSIGPAAQAGFDAKIADHWFLNADVKWAELRSDVKFDGTKISQARIDPLLFGIGVGNRFGGSSFGGSSR